MKIRGAAQRLSLLRHPRVYSLIVNLAYGGQNGGFRYYAFQPALLVHDCQGGSCPSSLGHDVGYEVILLNRFHISYNQ